MCCNIAGACFITEAKAMIKSQQHAQYTRSNILEIIERLSTQHIKDYRKMYVFNRLLDDSVTSMSFSPTKMHVFNQSFSRW